MREFIYYSKTARTSGNFTDLMKAGRIDIVCNVIIQAFFISHKTRDDMHLHLIFDGAPNPPMHLEIISNPNLQISKKDVAGLIKRMLYKCKKETKSEIFPGCYIEKKSLQALIKELEENGKNVRALDYKGEKLRELKNDDLKNSVFLIGDHDGLPKEIIKSYKKKSKSISIGKQVYFASQTFIIINNEIDLREL
jgi:tRNA pseudouridine-54 N-methylase